MIRFLSLGKEYGVNELLRRGDHFGIGEFYRSAAGYEVSRARDYYRLSLCRRAVEIPTVKRYVERGNHARLIGRDCKRESVLNAFDNRTRHIPYYAVVGARNGIYGLQKGIFFEKGNDIFSLGA